MMAWKKGKTFKKGRKTVRYIYKNGSKKNRKLVTVNSKKKTYSRRRY